MQRANIHGTVVTLQAERAETAADDYVIELCGNLGSRFNISIVTSLQLYQFLS